MYVYENHLGGDLFSSEELIPYEDLYCEECGDSDTLIGAYDPDSFKSALQFILDVSENSYTTEHIMQTVTSLFNIPQSAKISLYKVVSGITALYDEYLTAQFDEETTTTAPMCVRADAECVAQKDKPTYDVCVTETLQRVVKIEAENVDDAINKVYEKYANAEIVLTADDHKTTEVFDCT